MRIVWRASVAIVVNQRCQLTFFLDTPIVPQYKPWKKDFFRLFSHGRSKGMFRQEFITLWIVNLYVYIIINQSQSDKPAILYAQ